MERSTKEQPKKRLGTSSPRGEAANPGGETSWQRGRAQPYRPKPSACSPSFYTHSFLLLGYVV